MTRHEVSHGPGLGSKTRIELSAQIAHQLLKQQVEARAWVPVARYAGLQITSDYNHTALQRPHFWFHEQYEIFAALNLEHGIVTAGWRIDP